MTRHTSAPWYFDGPADNIIVWSGPNHRVCFMTSDGNAKANARLISAAPQLLEVVRLMQGADWKLDDEVGMEIRRRALVAVQKATDPIARDPSPQPNMGGGQISDSLVEERAGASHAHDQTSDPRPSGNRETSASVAVDVSRGLHPALHRSNSSDALTSDSFQASQQHEEFFAENAKKGAPVQHVDADDLRKTLERISAEATVANDVIRLNRDGGGNGRVKVATAMHRIAQWAKAALAGTPAPQPKEGKVRKGGINPYPSNVTSRPDPPGPSRAPVSKTEAS